MPTYEYRRHDGTTFDVFQKISDDALTSDPETGEPIKRVISGGAGLQFKGTGFYQTDYTDKGKKPPKSKSSDKSESSTGTEKPATEKKATETKPAASSSKESGGSSGGESKSD